MSQASTMPPSAFQVPSTTVQRGNEQIKGQGFSSLFFANLGHSSSSIVWVGVVSRLRVTFLSQWQASFQGARSPPISFFYVLKNPNSPVRFIYLSSSTGSVLLPCFSVRLFLWKNQGDKQGESPYQMTCHKATILCHQCRGHIHAPDTSNISPDCGI